MGTDKRARKRAARVEREEALRRRRNARIAGIGVVLALVLAGALFASGGDDKEPEPKPAPTEEELAACGAEPPEEGDSQQYDSPPEMALKENVDYRAVIQTSCGRIEMDLLEAKAPITVNNFVFLAREGFYDGLTWHRIERNFVIQGGDPEATGAGGPGYAIEDEWPDKANEYVYGIVGMANSGPNSGGSQFFIIVHEPKGKPAGLQPAYTIFAQVARSSSGTLDEIAAQETLGGDDPRTASRPLLPVYIDSIKIVEL